MKSITTWHGLIWMGMIASSAVLAETPLDISLSPVLAESPEPGKHPAVQYTLSIGRPVAAPAEAASDSLFKTSDAVAKARTQVEKELAILGTGGYATPARALVIPSESTDPKSLTDIEEDLSVMGLIVDKASSARDGKSAQAMGISIHGPLSSASVPRSIYLEGYGALFFLNVNYPLVPPASKKEDAKPKEETSTEWEDAKRELFQPSSYSSETPKFFAMDQSMGAFAFATGGQGEEYDAEKVEDLKKNLIVSLKNAVHIRKLKPDETVTIIVNGRNPVDTRTSVRRSSSSNNRPTANMWTVKTSTGDAKGTKLIVRGTRSDIEAFQKDKISLEEFSKKVTVMTY